jgi:hypothetical protein
MQKPILTALFCLLAQLCLAQSYQAELYEVAVLQEVNLVRSNPQAYRDTLHTYFENQNCDWVEKSKYPYDRAFRDAMAQLATMPIMQPVLYNNKLYKSQKEHQGIKNQARIFHDQAYIQKQSNKYKAGFGECIASRDWALTEDLQKIRLMARQCVVDFIIDDGVPSRGHCKIILTPMFNSCAVKVSMDTKDVLQQGTETSARTAILINFACVL